MLLILRISYYPAVSVDHVGVFTNVPVLEFVKKNKITEERMFHMLNEMENKNLFNKKGQINAPLI